MASSPQQTRWWTWSGRCTRRSWPPTPGRPWWPPPPRWRYWSNKICLPRCLNLTSRCPASSSQGWSAPSTCCPPSSSSPPWPGSSWECLTWKKTSSWSLLAEVWCTCCCYASSSTTVQFIKLNINSIYCTRRIVFLLFSQFIFHIFDLLSCVSQTPKVAKKINFVNPQCRPVR